LAWSIRVAAGAAEASSAAVSVIRSVRMGLA
jgi:hypothetical protein